MASPPAMIDQSKTLFMSHTFIKNEALDLIKVRKFSNKKKF